MAAGIPVAVTCSFFLGTLVAPRITVAFDVPDGLTAAAMDADMGEPGVPVGFIPAAAAQDGDKGELDVPVGLIPAAAAQDGDKGDMEDPRDPGDPGLEAAAKAPRALALMTGLPSLPMA